MSAPLILTTEKLVYLQSEILTRSLAVDCLIGASHSSIRGGSLGLLNMLEKRRKKCELGAEMWHLAKLVFI